MNGVHITFRYPSYSDAQDNSMDQFYKTFYGRYCDRVVISQSACQRQ
jgi:hypothetical protein